METVQRSKYNLLSDILGSDAECSDTISESPNLSSSGEEVNTKGGEREVVSTLEKEAKEESMEEEEATPEQEKTPDGEPDEIIDELTMGMSAEDLEDLSTELADQREQDRRRQRKGKGEMVSPPPAPITPGEDPTSRLRQDMKTALMDFAWARAGVCATWPPGRGSACSVRCTQTAESTPHN